MFYFRHDIIISVIRFQRWSSPALHLIHRIRHVRTCSFVHAPGVQATHHVFTTIGAIACPTCTPGGIYRTANDLYSGPPAAAVL